MILTRTEQETIVNYNAAEQTATVYTRDRAVMRRLDGLTRDYPDQYRLIDETDIDKTYEMPKTLINYRKPMSITEEQREAARERMKRINNDTENT